MVVESGLKPTLQTKAYCIQYVCHTSIRLVRNIECKRRTSTVSQALTCASSVHCVRVPQPAQAYKHLLNCIEVLWLHYFTLFKSSLTLTFWPRWCDDHFQCSGRKTYWTTGKFCPVTTGERPLNTDTADRSNRTDACYIDLSMCLCLRNKF